MHRLPQNCRLEVFDRASGKFLWKFDKLPAGQQAFENPMAVAVAGDQAFVVDGFKHCLCVLQLAVKPKGQ